MGRIPESIHCLVEEDILSENRFKLQYVCKGQAILRIASLRLLAQNGWLRDTSPLLALTTS